MLSTMLEKLLVGLHQPLVGVAQLLLDRLTVRDIPHHAIALAVARVRIPFQPAVLAILAADQVAETACLFLVPQHLGERGSLFALRGVNEIQERPGRQVLRGPPQRALPRRIDPVERAISDGVTASMSAKA
jgi:hypothetical protein